MKKFKICVEIQDQNVYFLKHSDHVKEFHAVQKLISKR